MLGFSPVYQNIGTPSPAFKGSAARTFPPFLPDRTTKRQRCEAIHAGPTPKCPAEGLKEECTKGCELGQWCPRMPRPS